MTQPVSNDKKGLNVDLKTKLEANSELESLLERQIWLTNELRNELFELTQKNKYDSIINSIIFSIHKSTNLNEIFDNAVESIYEIVECVDHVSIYITKNKTTSLKANRGFNQNQIDNLVYDKDEKGIIWQTIIENKTISCSDTIKDKVINEYEKSLGIKSYISSSIKYAGKAHGCLVLSSTETNNFDEQEIKLLNTVALQIEIALKHHFHEEKLKESQIQLEDKYELLSKVTNHEKILRLVAQSVHQSINLKDVMENAVDAMSKYILNNDYVGIYMVDGDKAVLQSQRGYSKTLYDKVNKIPKPKGFTWKTILEGKPLYVADAVSDKTIGKAGREAGTKSYASMPLSLDGKTVGTININSRIVNAFDEDELKLLETVAKQIETAINNARQAQLLKEANDELENRVEERTKTLMETNEKLTTEIKEKEVLLTEIHHRVKNNLQIITSLLNLQSNKLSDTGLLKVFDESKSRIKSMSILHEQLYKSKVTNNIDFKKYITDLSNHISRSYGTHYKQIKLIIDAEGAIIDINKAIPCGLIINELVSNAFEHGFSLKNNEGYIKIGFKEKNNNCRLSIINNGGKLPESFSFDQSNTLGLQLVSSLTKQLKGTIDFSNNNGEVVFNIKFNS